MLSMPIPHLYRSLHNHLLQRIPDPCDTRLTNLIYLMMGMFLAGSVQLPKIARKLPLRQQKLSVVKRLSRFLDNPAVRPRKWYAPIARQLLLDAGQSGEIRLIIDCSKVAFGFRLVMVAVAYRRRSLPIAWTWAMGSRGHTTTHIQLALLKYVRDALLPQHTPVLLVGDGEFSAGIVLDYLRVWGWNYVLRLACDTQVLVHGSGVMWQRVDSFPLKRDLALFLPRVTLTRAYPQSSHVLCFHSKTEQTAWFLATNLPSATLALQAYKRRMWIEEMFGDMKGNGFDLECSHLGRFLRLSRLTLAACLMYLWVMAMGEMVKDRQLHAEVDRRRGDLSLFRLGWDFIDRRLALCDPLPLVSLPNICSVSGS